MNTAKEEVPQSQVVSIPPKRTSLVEKVAQRFSVDPAKLLGTLKATAFRQKDVQISDEQMMALLVVADQHGLNPFTREIFAFPDKQNGIVPVVGIDGWSRIVNDHPQSDGFEFRESEKIVTPEGGKPCPEWMEIVIYRKDRSHPIIVREYIDEVYRPPFKKDDGRVINGPWQTHTKRFFRHKVFVQGARIAYGFGGIYDEDEAQRVIDAEVVSVQTSSATITRPRARSENAPMVATTSANQDAPLQVDRKPLGDAVVAVLKAKMTAATLSEAELFKRFEVESWNQLTTEELDDIKNWIADPTC